MAASYRNSAIGGAVAATADDVRALQQDLRSLGYLARGIDGVFADHTRGAVRALQNDLLHYDGRSTRQDGAAPIAMTAYNRGITAITGIVDAALADSIEAMVTDDRFAKLPRTSDPKVANRAVLDAVVARRSTTAPVPFLIAIFMQESACAHYAVPQGAADTDSYVVIGLDRSQGDPDTILSRGYGLGQYTLFHHPPSASEVADFVPSPWGNAQAAATTLRDKFDHFINGRTPNTAADDRIREHPILDLRLCRYSPSDARYMSDCKACAREVPAHDIDGATPVYAGATLTYGQAPHYASARYAGVPDRAQFLCDWPYAVRRYNGGGADSFNYQARVLTNLLSVPSPVPGV